MIKDTFLISTRLRTLLGAFHPETLEPDQGEPDARVCMNGWTDFDRQNVEQELHALVSSESKVAEWLGQRIGDDVRDEVAARDFLRSLALFVVDPNRSQPDVGEILL
ncbi:hypothetical protein [uncultured Litoreibacter sp.]|uniref:hypothetical protein n=1 Tax=uncultured Litoreibacter sp. TaxID=1392394 RepID=UPI002628E948|nr:hypothetical protein [uncultured Litoreibacter sp.]